MQIEPLNLPKLNCFRCNFLVAKHKCKIQLSEVVFIIVCLCDICVKLGETELRIFFMGNQSITVKRDLLIKSDDLERFAEIERKSGRPGNQK